ncbi:MAG: DUF4260 domain-containing protein [Chitinophagaceae bacterium]
MKNLIKFEEAAMLGLSIFLLAIFHATWWWYPLLAIGPDISILGYSAGNKIGAFCYNLFHHKAIAIMVFITGYFLNNDLLQQTGIVLFGHSSMDRMFGYGLKTNEGFKFTHLGVIGKK